MKDICCKHSQHSCYDLLVFSSEELPKVCGFSVSVKPLIMVTEALLSPILNRETQGLLPTQASASLLQFYLETQDGALWGPVEVHPRDFPRVICWTSSAAAAAARALILQGQ